MDLKQRISDAMKAAMRAGDKPRLTTIRLIQAAIKQREVDERVQLDDAEVLAVLEKMLKQRRDSVQQYQAAGRQDLAARERAEIDIIGAYLPTPLSQPELDALIEQALAESGAASPRDMGKVMTLLKKRAAGRADMAAVSRQFKARLS